jgi:NADPH:quinone reductase-like Zn-dependent oxidoreductase
MSHGFYGASAHDVGAEALMKAVYFTKHAGIEKLIDGDLPDPRLGENEVLVRVRVCGLNHVDRWVRQGLPFLG